jgi:hypothetical protein
MGGAGHRNKRLVFFITNISLQYCIFHTFLVIFTFAVECKKSSSYNFGINALKKTISFLVLKRDMAEMGHTGILMIKKNARIHMFAFFIPVYLNDLIVIFSLEAGDRLDRAHG